MVAEQVGFVADLEVLQAGAERSGDIRGFLGGAFRGIGAHADTVETVPVCSFEKAGEVSDCLGSDGVKLGLGLAFYLAGFGVLGFGRVGGSFPPAKLAGVAAQAQYAMRREGLELANEAGVCCGKEGWVGELPHFIGESDEVGGDVRAGGLGRDFEGDGGRRRTLRAEADCGGRKRGGSDEFAAAGGIHGEASIDQRSAFSLHAAGTFTLV